MLVDAVLLETYNPMPDVSVELIPPLHVMQPPPPDDAGVVLFVMDNETPDAVVRLRYTVVPKYELPTTPIPPPKVAHPVVADVDANVPETENPVLVDPPYVALSNQEAPMVDDVPLMVSAELAARVPPANNTNLVDAEAVPIARLPPVGPTVAPLCT